MVNLSLPVSTWLPTLMAAVVVDTEPLLPIAVAVFLSSSQTVISAYSLSSRRLSPSSSPG